MKNFRNVSLVVAAIYSIGLLGSVTVLAAGPAAINLGAAGNFAILAKTGVSVTGSSMVVGDIGISPAVASYITGFGLILPAASPFSTSALVSGKIYAPDYANPTPANLTTAVLDMQNAYTDGAGRASTVTEQGAGNIGGLTLVPGVYKWGTGVTIPTDVTLTGGANDVWIFVVAQNLTVGSGAKVVLSGGAQPNNIFWIVAGQTTIGTTAVFNGNILDQTAIVLGTGAVLNGRALAQSAVTLDSNSVTTPSGSGVIYTPPVTSVPPPVSNPVLSPVSVNPPVNVVDVNYSPTINDIQSPVRAVYQGGQSMPALDYMGNRISPAGTYLPASSAYSNSGQQIRTIAMDLMEGNKNGDVAVLQQFLISLNLGPSARALANVGATSYFGNLTRAALAEFQASVGVSPAVGYFGPITRGYINAHY